MARKGRLYRGGAKSRQLRSFERRYGAARGKRIYGAVVGKVHREQVALHERGAGTEHVRAGWVPSHMSRRGRTRFRVKGHRVRAHKARIRV